MNGPALHRKIIQMSFSYDHMKYCSKTNNKHGHLLNYDTSL